MKALIAASVLVVLAGAAGPASAGPWWGYGWRGGYGPYAYGPRFRPWGLGPRRFAYRRYYGGFRGYYGGGYGGGHQTITGGPSGGKGS